MAWSSNEENDFLGIFSDRPSPSESAAGQSPQKFYQQKNFLRALAYGGVVLFFAAAFLAYQFFVAVSADAAIVKFTVESGESVRSISNRLHDQGLVRYPIFFELYIRARGLSRNVQAGEYSLQKNMDIRQIAAVIAENPSPREMTIMIPEGWTIRDMAKYFQDNGLFSSAEFLRAVQKDYSADFPFTKDISLLRTVPRTDAAGEQYLLQGYLFPDTYRVYKDADPEDVIAKMLANFEKKYTQDLKDEAAKQKKSMSEIIIMASLIEREVRTPEDKAIVSGILWKRLRLGIALQVDASVVYAKTKGYSRNGTDKVYYEDLKVNSLYNTYKYPGLTPGPVANPGIESIKAALYPKTSPYLYYLSKPDGTTVFSRTLAEHNAAKAKYLK